MASTDSRWVSSTWAHLLLIAAVSIGYESLFIRHWLNVVDEGLTLYAAMQVHAGGTLYRDVSFVFPPGHLLVPWIAYGIDPPGVVLSRVLFAALNVALCLALLPLARRIMPARWALFGVLLVAVASPLSHRAHLLFGFRYLVFSVLALLAFARRLETGDRRFSLLAGVWIGVAVCFRLTPAFAAAVGIGLGLLASARDVRGFARDAGAFLLGGGLVVLPVVAWFASGVGLETLWREVVVRPVVMTDLQSLPVPDLEWPESLANRDHIHDAFVPVLFRVCGLVYLGTVGWVGLRWLRALRAGRPFDDPLLLAVIVWGAVYFLRTLGRSDEPHLSSAIPPFLLVVAWWLHRLAGRIGARAGAAVAAVVALVWVVLPGADRALDGAYRGDTPFEALGGRVVLHEDDWWHVLTPKLREIRERTRPDERILDLTASPLLYVLVDRLGPGWFDTVMPGTFLSDDEETFFVEHLAASPPALVVLPSIPFDEMEERALSRTAPRLMAWVARHYQVVGNPEDFLLLEPREPREIGDGPAAPRPPAPPLHPMDPAEPLDRLILDAAADLDANQVTDLFLRLHALETRPHWFDGTGAFPDGDTHIGIGGALRGRDLASLRAPLRVLLAHHQAHGMQARAYTSASLHRPGNRRLLEAQADVLAGITLAQAQTYAERPMQELRREAPGAVDFLRELGGAAGWETPALPDRLRERLLLVGRNVGIYYLKVWTCVTNLDEPETREVFENTLRSIAADRRRNPALPAFDPRTCRAEDVFDWTLRAAARELAREDALAAQSSSR
ncbi:MAG: hypothetical protein ACQGVC_03590 [Myxococcota bacterium]